MVIRMHIDVVCHRTGIFWWQELNWTIINDNSWIGQPNRKELAINGKITRFWQNYIQTSIRKVRLINRLTKRNIFVIKQIFEENDSLLRQGNYWWTIKWWIFTVNKIDKIILIQIVNDAILITIETHCLN